ncbi:hypothetical protein PR003_g1624 [Phytophthora rubi]|uniref:Uncharacterized protein n=1 Tax=Phytophthora rubi TaxID=129364 RepID=A0A6A4G8X0_9STRA|nr:hypothetical protein PR001_g1019 [Phytophthora rubi]KAE9357792.1 hypothetical protein PR003_g1624 [Phytophthora rubi]
MRDLRALHLRDKKQASRLEEPWRTPPPRAAGIQEKEGGIPDAPQTTAEACSVVSRVLFAFVRVGDSASSPERQIVPCDDLTYVPALDLKVFDGCTELDVYLNIPVVFHTHNYSSADKECQNPEECGQV